MAHKHNRRRIRPRRGLANSSLSPPPDMLSLPGITEVATPLNPRGRLQLKASKPSALVPSAFNTTRLNDLTAQHWQNRYISWQNRERQQRAQEVDAAKLEADQCRLFGGEPGDDTRDDHDLPSGHGETDSGKDATHPDGDVVEIEGGISRDEGRGGYNALK